MCLSSFATVGLGCGSGSVDRDPETEQAAPWEPPDEVPPGSPVARHGQLRLDGTQIVDESGAPYQLKGISTQWLNFEGSFSRNGDNVIWMRDNWNLQLIRGAMGIETNGGYLADAEYMTERLEMVVQNAIDAGVYVIIDWHDHNAHLNQAKAVDFFRRMAKKWGDYPHIIWETFNEPTRADWVTELKPYHEAAVAAIRSADPDNLIVLGNPIWSQQPNAPATTNAPVEGENLLYTLHFYACTHDASVRANGQAALDAGFPVFVTEWGATTADGGLPDPVTGAEGEPCEAEGQEWMDWMNDNRISWAAWRLQGCPDVTCILKGGSRYSGGWTEDDLHGHGPFVVRNLLD